MRVIAGSARSIPLVTPEGDDTRPTQDRIKETLFNMIQFEVADSVFVDLFAGSGGIGIEALSRGARKAYFVDNGAKPIQCIKNNLNKTKLMDKAQIFNQDCIAFLSSLKEKVDFIFMDPPYNQEHEKRALFTLKDSKAVTEWTTIIVEASLDTDFSYAEDYGFEIVKTKTYKTNQHVFLKKKD